MLRHRTKVLMMKMFFYEIFKVMVHTIIKAIKNLFPVEDNSKYVEVV